jgi:hypothetical protein
MLIIPIMTVTPKMLMKVMASAVRMKRNLTKRSLMKKPRTRRKIRIKTQ